MTFSGGISVDPVDIIARIVRMPEPLIGHGIAVMHWKSVKEFDNHIDIILAVGHDATAQPVKILLIELIQIIFRSPVQCQPRTRANVQRGFRVPRTSRGLMPALFPNVSFCVVFPVRRKKIDKGIKVKRWRRVGSTTILDCVPIVGAC